MLRIKFFLSFLVGLWLYPALLQATTFGPDQVLQCPNSSQVIRQKVLNSGNSVGAINWSDGYTYLPMLPQVPAITRCGQGPYFWIAEAKVLGEITQEAKIPEAWKKAPEVRILSTSEYLEALSQKIAKNPQQERYLRIKTWWSSNDAVRNSKSKNPFNPFQNASPERENLETLLQMLDTSDPDQLLMKAEALRELGRFAEALEVLKTPLDKEYQEPQKKLIKLAKKKDSLVAKLFEDNK